MTSLTPILGGVKNPENEDLIWSAGPTMERLLAIGQPTRWPAATEAAADSARRVSGTTSVRHVVFEGTMLVWTTENQRRVLAASLPRCREIQAPSSGTRSARGLGALALSGPVRAVVASLADVPRVMRGGLARELYRAARATEMARRVLEDGVERIVVASQHDTLIRALLRAGHRAGLPTAYIPHSTYFDDPRYRDLPVDLALLPGDAELNLYADLGARQAGLVTVGMATIPKVPAGAVDTSRWFLALSADDHADNQRTLNMAAEAGLEPDQAIVLPHPRTTRRTLRYAEETGYQVLSGRTIDLVVARRHPVVAAGSGILLEALCLGVPVVDLRDAGGRGRRPALEAPELDRVSDVEGLSAALRRLQASGGFNPALTSWTRRWVAATGADAADRVETALATMPRAAGPLALDRWSALLRG